jgi:ABC-2 type transport system permease protein
MRELARNTWIIARREFASYFATPLAMVFLIVFVALTGAFTFYLGGFFDRGQADLAPFFQYHPWLYLLLVPAVAMRLWAEERKSGTLELLLTQPVSTWQAVLGKFLAAWVFLGLALALTFPMWITVNWLGDADNGVILASYVGSWLLAGALLAVGGCLSATTRSQVIAFILAVVISVVLMLAGFELVLDLLRGYAPQRVVDAVSGLSFLTHFQAITRGVLDLRDVVFFVLAIGAWLLATVAVIELKKAD